MAVINSNAPPPPPQFINKMFPVYLVTDGTHTARKSKPNLQSSPLCQVACDAVSHCPGELLHRSESAARGLTLVQWKPERYSEHKDSLSLTTSTVFKSQKEIPKSAASSQREGCRGRRRRRNKTRKAQEAV